MEAVQSQDLELDDDDEEEASTSDGETTSADLGGDSRADSEGDDSSVLEAPDGELDPIEQLKNWGIFVIEAGGKVLDWGINNLEGKKPFTFWLWEVDPANVYPKGLGVDLVPLQKRLNRLDSLMELGIMSNAQESGCGRLPRPRNRRPAALLTLLNMIRLATGRSSRNLCSLLRSIRPASRCGKRFWPISRLSA
jgi:hypothetical protein